MLLDCTQLDRTLLNCAQENCGQFFGAQFSGPQPNPALYHTCVCVRVSEHSVHPENKIFSSKYSASKPFTCTHPPPPPPPPPTPPLYVHKKDCTSVLTDTAFFIRKMLWGRISPTIHMISHSVKSANMQLAQKLDLIYCAILP